MVNLDLTKKTDRDLVSRRVGRTVDKVAFESNLVFAGEVCDRFRRRYGRMIRADFQDMCIRSIRNNKKIRDDLEGLSKKDALNAVEIATQKIAVDPDLAYSAMLPEVIGSGKYEGYKALPTAQGIYRMLRKYVSVNIVDKLVKSAHEDPVAIAELEIRGYYIL